MKYSIARSRVQRWWWMPVSTTSRIARQSWVESMPNSLIGSLVEAHLLAEPLGIEAPALAIGAVAAEAAELGHVRQLLRQRDLEMMAGRALMIGDRLDLRAQHLVHVGEVDVEDAGPRAVGRGPVVEGDRGGLLPERLDRADLQRRARQAAEPARRRLHHLRDEARGASAR